MRRGRLSMRMRKGAVDFFFLLVRGLCGIGEDAEAGAGLMPNEQRRESVMDFPFLVF